MIKVLTLAVFYFLSILFYNLCNSFASENNEIARLFNFTHIQCKRPKLNVSNKQFLMNVAKDTWGYFKDIVDKETGLPLDNVILYSDHCKVNSYTSTTNIGLYLMCIVGAYDLGLISQEKAVWRINLVLDSLRLADTWKGQFYNYYKTATLASSGDYISTVDNGWLAAGLIVAKQAFPKEVGVGCQEILNQLDFGKLYDKKEGHFFLGYDTKVNKYSKYHYGLLCTEPRIVSYIAIAKGDVPDNHWFKLYRTFPKEWDWQQQIPNGKVKEYFGQKIFQGYYKYKHFKYVPSWGGSMFEFLMPTLVLDEQTLAKENLGKNNKNIVAAHIHYALNESKYPVWGISPCAIPEDPCGYCEYGIKVLGVKGYDDCNVISPHATFLALEIEPRKAIKNLRNLSKFNKIYGRYGFFDSVNLSTRKVNTKYLCLDQAMIFISICNYLKDGSIRRRFHNEPIIQSKEHILAAEQFY